MKSEILINLSKKLADAYYRTVAIKMLEAFKRISRLLGRFFGVQRVINGDVFFRRILIGIIHSWGHTGKSSNISVSDLVDEFRYYGCNNCRIVRSVVRRRLNYAPRNGDDIPP